MAVPDFQSQMLPVLLPAIDKSYQAVLPALQTEMLERLRTEQDLTQRYAWSRSSVRDVRRLRIEENNDFAPAIERPARD